MEPLTEKQGRILQYIESRLADGEPPSQREIAGHFNLTQNAVYQHVTYLRKKGYLSDSPGHRGLRLSEKYVDSKTQTEGMPLLGSVAAGQPILAEENIEAWISPKDVFPEHNGTFLLRVVGDSMIDEGIMEGDLVAVDPNAAVRTGQIAVVMLDDEATVKRVYIHKSRIALKSANAAAGYKTRYIKKSEKSIKIIGKVTACLRTNIK